MKKITITFNVMQLLVGVLAIAVVSSLYSFVLSDKNDKLLYDNVTVEVANNYFNNNKNSAQPFGNGTYGISISKDQFNAMKKLDREIDSDGYRCYFAKNSSGQNVSIVVGINLENRDITSNIKLSDAGLFATCPSYCDDNSPITAE